MLRVDRPTVLLGHLGDGGPARGHLGGHDERRQPAVAQASHPAQLGGGEAAEPDVGRLLERLRDHLQCLEVEARAVVVDGVLQPQAPDQRQGLVEPRRPLAACHAEGLLLVGVGDAETEGRQEPPAREAVEAGQLLGQHHGVAAGQHQDAGAELQLLRASRGERHAHDRVGGLAAEALGEPEAVEAQPLEGIDRVGEALVVELGARAQAVADADLHPGIVAHADQGGASPAGVPLCAPGGCPTVPVRRPAAHAPVAAQASARREGAGGRSPAPRPR